LPNSTNTGLSLDAYFDKVFYINLEKDVARNENMIKQFYKLSISNFERIDAIELKELPGLEKYRNFIKKDKRYVIGQLSARASHLKCIRIASERNYKRILILEDDVEFLMHPNELLEQNRAILNDWDMLYFGGLIEPHFRNQVVGGYAYGVASKLFDDIINMAEASGMEIDNFYAKILQHMSYNYNASGRYNIRLTFPFNLIFPSQSFKSNIQG